MEIKGDTYKERCLLQLDEWVNGNPIHNKVDDECCPDFSCCKPEFLADELTRQTFKAAYLKGDEDTTNGMLLGFLASGISQAFPKKNIHVTDGNMSYKKDMN